MPKNDILRQTPRFLFWVVILLLSIPFGGNAQTVPAVTEVAILPFVTADDAATALQLHNAAVSEVNNLGTYLVQEVSADQYPDIADLRPDIPPDPAYLGTAKYALTGEFYLDMENLQHVQLWLWTSDTGRLVFTDEMVTENYEEALMYMPPLLNWLLSQIPPEEAVPVADVFDPAASPISVPNDPAADAVDASKNAEEPKGLFLGQLYLGVRAGVTFNSYSIAVQSWGYEGSLTQSFAYEAAFLAEFRILRFLTLQAEAIFSPDALMIAKIINGQNTVVVDKFDLLSLTFPLLLKVPLEVGVVNLSFYTGAYAILPLGKTRIKSEVEAGVYNAKTDPPLGFVFGLDLGFLLGPGRFLVDMRYSKDFGITTVQSPVQLPYNRARISVSLGYKFLLWQRK
jgi:hypothetical protein